MQFVSEASQKGKFFHWSFVPGLAYVSTWPGEVMYDGRTHLVTITWSDEVTLSLMMTVWDEVLQKQDILYHSCKAMSAKLNFKFVCRFFLPSFMWCLELLLETFERGLISINSWNASFVKKISKDSQNGVRCSILISSYCESCVYCKCVILIDN